jgi:hypothetical protein
LSSSGGNARSSYSKEHPELNGKNERNHPAKFPESHINRGKGGESLLTNPSQIEIKKGDATMKSQHKQIATQARKKPKNAFQESEK